MTTHSVRRSVPAGLVLIGTLALALSFAAGATGSIATFATVGAIAVSSGAVAVSRYASRGRVSALSGAALFVCPTACFTLVLALGKSLDMLPQPGDPPAFLFWGAASVVGFVLVGIVASRFECKPC